MDEKLILLEQLINSMSICDSQRAERIREIRLHLNNEVKYENLSNLAKHIIDEWESIMLHNR